MYKLLKYQTSWQECPNEAERFDIQIVEIPQKALENCTEEKRIPTRPRKLYQDCRVDIEEE